MHDQTSVDKLVVGITADFDNQYLDRLEELADVRFGGWGVSGALPNEQELTEFLTGVDVLVVAWEEITASILDNSNLRYIASVRGGPGGNVDLHKAAEQGIPVTGTSGRESTPVAEFTIGLMIGLLRHLSLTSRLMHERVLTSFDPPPPGDIGWGMNPEDPWIKYRGGDLSGRRLGLVGLGAIGQMVASRAAAFDMEVVAHDPLVTDSGQIPLLTLDELMETSDVISIHARYSEATHHLIGKHELGLMKPTAILVNTARPNLVDYDALLAALNEQRLAGAALDVHVKEPMDPDDPFLDMDNVICTPHIAGSSYGVTAVQSLQVVENIERFARGEDLHVLVNDVSLPTKGSTTG